MSILSTTYMLCNSIQRTDARNKIQETFRLATQPAQADMFTGRDRGMLEYYSRNRGAQFKSYLLTSQERATFLERNNLNPNSGLAYPSMDPEHLEVFENAHRALIELNDRCLTPIVTVLPNARKAVDPYSTTLTYRFISSVRHMNFIPKGVADSVVEEFRNHPAMKIALETSQQVDDSMSENDYLRAVLQAREAIEKFGPLTVPPNFEEIERTTSKSSHTRMLFRHIVSLLCISVSLRILNQHIFQAIIRDKPLALTEDDLIDNGFPAIHHLVGTARTILYQVPSNHKIVEGYELVLLKAPTINLDELCEVAYWRMTFRYGQTMELQVRVIDENLNPYPSLLDRM